MAVPCGVAASVPDWQLHGRAVARVGVCGGGLERRCVSLVDVPTRCLALRIRCVGPRHVRTVPYPYSEQNSSVCGGAVEPRHASSGGGEVAEPLCRGSSRGPAAMLERLVTSHEIAAHHTSSAFI